MGLGLLFLVVCEGQHFAGNVTGVRAKVFDLNAELNGDFDFEGLYITGEINVTGIKDSRSSLAVNITVLNFGDSGNGSMRRESDEEPYCIFILMSTCKTMRWGSQKDTKICIKPEATEGYHTTTTMQKVYVGTSGLMTGWCAPSWMGMWRKLSTTIAYGRTQDTLSKESKQHSRFNIHWAATCL